MKCEATSGAFRRLIGKRAAYSRVVLALSAAFTLSVFAAPAPHDRESGRRASADPDAATIDHAVIVTIGDEVGAPLRLDRAALAAYPRTVVAADDHGTRSQWEGVRLIEILKTAGAPSGETLRGPALRRYVRIDAADGYAAVFALAELDMKFTDDIVILADMRDGKPLSAHEGPFRIIATGDKRPGRWVRQVTSITVLQADVAR